MHEYTIKDHLGNARVTYSDGNNDGIVTVADIKQINHYYPFGMNMEGSWNGAAGSNKYQYNGKEWNDDFGLGLNDYGARFYDPSVSRWTSKDPLSELRADVTPYQYVQNNPINAIDPTGMLDESFYGRDIKAIGEDIQQKAQNGDFNNNSNNNQKGSKLVPFGTRTYVNGILQSESIDGYNIVEDCGCGGEGEPPCPPSLDPSNASLSLWERTKKAIKYSFEAWGWVAKESAVKSAKVIDDEYLFSGGQKIANGEYVNGGVSITAGVLLSRVPGIKKTSGWVKKSIFNSLDPAIKKKIVAAIENGIVAPTGKQGIIKLTTTEAAQTGYQFKIKILGKGGDIRIYGNALENGHILFDYITGH